jgi:hypothetical protein
MSNRETSDYTHGDQGAWPPSGTNFQNGDTLNAQPVDKLFWYLTEKSRDFANEFDRLDSDNDGVVDEADYAYDANATLYKGSDIDSNGDGTVDAAEFATNAEYADSAGNADTVDNQDWADIKNWVNTQSDVPNAEYADNAGDADTLDGIDSSEFARLYDGVKTPVYASKSDVPNGIGKGELVFIDGDGLYVEDGT